MTLMIILYILYSAETMQWQAVDIFISISYLQLVYLFLQWQLGRVLTYPVVMNQDSTQQQEYKFSNREQESIFFFDQQVEMSAYSDFALKKEQAHLKKAKTDAIITPSDLTIEQKDEIIVNLAEKFITIGHGYSRSMKALKKRGLKVVSSSVYNNMMTGIAKKAFRTLQAFLMNECKQQLKPLSMYECSLIRSPMIQGAKWLAKQDLSTLYKFIIRGFHLNKKVYISEDQASRLYGQLLQSASIQNEVSHLMLHRHRKKQADPKDSQGLKFSYAPSTVVSTNRA